jgi:hypothetical protein
VLEVEERVNHLDELMAQLLKTVDQTSREMREFKEEMREFKDEMREFKDEMRDLKKNSDKQWGELSKKLGTMAEDLVAPSIPRILKQVTGCTEELDYFACRIKVKKPQTKEFDVIAVCGDYVFVNETKNTLRSEYINNFYETMQRIHEYFPLWTEKRFIGAIASLYVDEMLVRQGEKLGLIVLGFGEELMDVLNSPGFKPREF